MENKSYKDTLLRGIALLGLILILVLGAWGIIVLAFNAPSFLSSAGATIAGLFERDGETVEVPVVSTSTEPTSPAAPAAPASPSATGGTKTTTSPKPTYTQAPTVGTGQAYTPAAVPAPRLYGLPDLAVRIISIVPQGNRYSMQFEITNVGTNVAASGWSFNANLPLDPSYTYASAPQQALQPGDKIIYTLGFDTPRYRDYDRYDDCDRWDDDDDEWYDYNCDRYDYRYPDYNYGGDVVSVTVDPFGRIYEQNRYNNTASQNLSYNYAYYPTYPQYPYYPYMY